ncbi:MAG TPA: hypothetical protein VF040_08680 [Ktedonobacterales bacterium]
MRVSKQTSAYAGLFAILATLAVLVGLSGCTTVTEALSPSELRVSIDIKDYHQGTTRVAIHFSDHALNTVEFVHGETVTCNGVFLKYDSGYYARMLGYGAYIGDVPRQSSGGAYTFGYTPAAAGGGATSRSGDSGAIRVAVAVVNAPVALTNPINGAIVSIPRSGPFVVQYAPSGVSNSIIVGSASDSRAHIALSLALRDAGSTRFNAADFKNFAPGAGLLSLSRITSSKPGNTPFAAVDASYENITTISVTWQ